MAALIGALVAAALGALIAIPVRRLGALALALATFALAFVADLTVFDNEPIGKGPIGWSYPLPKLNVFGIVTFDFSQPRTQTMMLLLVFGILTLLIHNLQALDVGPRPMLAVRSSQVAARTSGISPAKSEIMLFALSAGIAGFGGVMLGMTNGFVSNTSARHRSPGCSGSRSP